MLLYNVALLCNHFFTIYLIYFKLEQELTFTDIIRMKQTSPQQHSHGQQMIDAFSKIQEKIE
jgi:hypothetical protein